MDQIPLPFSDQEDSVNTPRTICVAYENSDFDIAIAGAHEAYGERAAVIAIPVGCRLVSKKRNAAKRRT